SVKPRPDACEHVKRIVADLGPGIMRNLEEAARSPELAPCSPAPVSLVEPHSQLIATALPYSSEYHPPPPLPDGGVIEYHPPPPNRASPGDLARSPSLNCVGRLTKARES